MICYRSFPMQASRIQGERRSFRFALWILATALTSRRKALLCIKSEAADALFARLSNERLSNKVISKYLLSFVVPTCSKFTFVPASFFYLQYIKKSSISVTGATLSVGSASAFSLATLNLGNGTR